MRSTTSWLLRRHQYRGPPKIEAADPAVQLRAGGWFDGEKFARPSLLRRPRAYLHPTPRVRAAARSATVSSPRRRWNSAEALFHSLCAQSTRG